MDTHLSRREVVPINDPKNIAVLQRNEMGNLFTVKKTQPWVSSSARRKTHHPFFLFVVGVAVQSLSRVWLAATPWSAALQASLSFTISQSLLRLMSIESVMPSNHLILCRPLLLLPSIFPSIRVFSNESALRIRWLKDYSFNVSISPSNEYSGLIYFWIDWPDLPAVQGTLKSLLQHHSSKASVLSCSAFFLL